MSSRIEDHVTFTSGIAVQSSAALPDGCIYNAAIANTAAIANEKMEHIHISRAAQTNAAAADATEIVHIGHGATGTVVGFRCSSIGACVGDSTVTFDLKKNGTTCLSGVVTLNSSIAAYQVVEGTITVSAYVKNDVFTVVTDATVGTGTLATGVCAEVIVHEEAD